MADNATGYLQIRQIQNWVTNVDPSDLREDIAIRTRGFRHDIPGYIAKRDYGTQHVYPNYPEPVADAIIAGYRLYLPLEGKEYQILVGIDKDGNTRMFMTDGSITNGQVTWEELTFMLTGTITAISGNNITVDGLTAINGDGSTITDHQLRNYIAVSDAVAGYIVDNQGTTLTIRNDPVQALGWRVGSDITIYRFTGLVNGFAFGNGLTPNIDWLEITEQKKLNIVISDNDGKPKSHIHLRKGKYLTHEAFGGGWTRANDIPALSGFQINDLSILDQEHAIVCGVDSFGRPTVHVASSRNSNGYVWGNAQYLSGPGIELYSAHWVDTNKIVVSGSNSWVFISTDGGQTWSGQQIWTADNFKLYAVRFADSNVGYVVGGVPAFSDSDRKGRVFKTTNGGATWTSVRQYSFVEFVDLFVFTPNVLYVLATRGENPPNLTLNSTLHITTDGGTNWILRIMDTVGRGPLLKGEQKLFFFDTQNGLCVDHQEKTGVYRTIDGGATWRQVLDTQEKLFYIAFKSDSEPLDKKRGIVAGRTRKAYITQDGGLSWTTVVKEPIFTETGWRALGSDGEYFYGITNLGLNYRRLITQSNELAEGFYIDRGQMMPEFASVGASNDPIKSGSGESIISNAVKIAYSFNESAADEKHHVRFYITAKYGDYQHSEPIWQAFFSGSDGTFPSPTITIAVDLARIDKTIQGFNVWAAMKKDSEIVNLGGLSHWLDDANEYVLVRQIKFTDVGWEKDNNSRYSEKISFSVAKGSIEIAQISQDVSLFSQLGHAPMKKRTYVRPRFMIKLDRPQASLVVIDQDDHTLRFSARSGSGVNMDDSFPDLSVDALGDKLKLQLLGKGEILSLEVHDGNIVVLRPAEYEVHDPYSGISRISPTSVVSKKSILSSSEPGTSGYLVWAGVDGIHIMRPGRAYDEILSQPVNNFLNGTLKIANGVPFVAVDDLKNLLAVYDQLFGEFWFQVAATTEDGQAKENLCLRVNPRTGKWNVRKLSINGEVRFYNIDRDGLLLLGYKSGLLRYPKFDAYEDGIGFFNEPGVGIEGKVRFVLGSLFRLASEAFLTGILFQMDASSNNGLGIIEFKLYRGHKRILKDTKKIPVDGRQKRRRLKPFGPSSYYEFEIEIPESERANCREVDIRHLEIGYEVKERVGTY